MGALEALNGMLLFGLTTAFLFAMIQKVWPYRGSPTSVSFAIFLGGQVHCSSMPWARV
jgi:hypothetical protein